MQRIFGVKKNKDPPPSVQDASDMINKRGENVDEKIKKLDAELARYKEQIKKIRPGPAQEAVKARAMRVLKQKRMYESQRDMLYNQTFNLDQVSFAAEGIKDAQQTMSAMKAANKDLKGMMKTVKIQEIDNLQDEMMDLMDISNEIQETLGRSYNVPDDIDEDDLMGELDALEMDMESESQRVPSYLQPEPDVEEELNLPPAPTSVPPGRANAQREGTYYRSRASKARMLGGRVCSTMKSLSLGGTKRATEFPALRTPRMNMACLLYLMHLFVVKGNEFLKRLVFRHILRRIQF